MSAAPQLDDGALRTTAPFGRRLAAVLENRSVGAYRVITVDDEGGAAAPPRPGQFYMLATAVAWGAGRDERPFLPRAFSVLRSRPAHDGLRLEFLLEDVGPGTARLAAVKPTEQLWLTGPLGRGFAPPAAEPADAAEAAELAGAPDGSRASSDPGRALLVGGGVGIAPLAIWQDELLARGIEAPALLGFRDAARAHGASLLTAATVTTDDGSVGRHGLVTELLADALAAAPATVYACGPPAMLESVRRLCVQRGAPAQLALEAPMACGYGACFGCVVATADGGYRRVCLDGPVFDAAQLSPLALDGHR